MAYMRLCRHELTVRALKSLLGERNLSTTGNKTELVERLVNFANDPSAWEMY